MPIDLKDIVFKAFDTYFRTRTLLIDTAQIDAALLTEANIVQQTDKHSFQLNTDSIALNEYLVEYIGKDMQQSLPENIEEAFEYINRFEEQKKAENNCSSIVNVYSPLINGLKTYLFYRLHTQQKIDLTAIIQSYDEDDRLEYGEYAMRSMLLSDMEVARIYKNLSAFKGNDDHSLPSFCRELGGKSPEKAWQLYHYAREQKNEDDFYILANLLMGLYPVDSEATFLQTKELLPESPLLASFVLGRLEYKDEKHIVESFEWIQKLHKLHPNQPEALMQVPYFCRVIIENAVTPAGIKTKCFELLKRLFTIENEKLRDHVFSNCRFMSGYEEERYRLLTETFLVQSENYFERINDYLSRFTDPDYFFHLFISFCYIMSERGKIPEMKISLFDKALAHFWRTQQEKTENQLLFLLSHNHPDLRISAVKLIQSKYSGYYGVNVLKLNSEREQLRALEVLLFYSFYNIDVFLPIILPLSLSPYPAVVDYLQKALSELIFESYHDHLYHAIAKWVNDRKFLRPLKKSLESYHKYADRKQAVNELNPYRNESELLEFYYGLQHEEDRKLMGNIDEKEPFLSMVKTVKIVRGNSWQIRDNEVSPLGKMEYTFALDKNMYKNPDLFDREHYQFISSL